MSTKNSPHTSKPEPEPDVFQAIADPTRRHILQLLTRREMSIASIARHFPVSRTAVNKHLQVLLTAGLVSSRKIGRETRYKAQPQPLLTVREWLGFFEQYWHEKLHALKQFVEGEAHEDPE